MFHTDSKTNPLLLFPLLTTLTILLQIVSLKAQQADTSSISSERQSGAIIIRAYMILTPEQYRQYILDSLLWHELKPLKKYYAGKKIKRILYQKSTDRLVVFAKESEMLQMKHAEAVREGLIEEDPQVIAKRKNNAFVPQLPVQMYLDSPLYVGNNNQVTIQTSSADDIIQGTAGVDVKRSGQEDKFAVQVSLPGNGEIDFIDSASKRTKYIYHFIARRLPGDDLAKDPGVFLGSIRTMNVTGEQLKAQNKITVTDNLYFESATVYFSGNGFKDVIIADIKNNLGYVKCYLDCCLPGSVIIFDNIRVRDINKKIYSASNLVLHVIDSAYLSDPATDYMSLSAYPDFYGSNNTEEYYIKNALKLSPADSVPPGNQNVFLMLRIAADGKIVSPCESERTMTRLEKICFDIIRNGPVWAPGRFREQAVEMIVPVSFMVDVDEYMSK